MCSSKSYTFVAEIALYLIVFSCTKVNSAVPDELGNLGLDLNGLQDTFKGLESVMEMFGGMNGKCEIKCSEGETLVNRVEYAPSHNGCGSLGVELALDDFPQMTECCNIHDTCYEKCGTDKKECDEALKVCTHDMCTTAAQQDNKVDEEGLKACVALSEMMHQTTTLLGCKSFRQAQEAACKCVADDEVGEENSKTEL